jgi:hypothetical protein
MDAAPPSSGVADPAEDRVSVLDVASRKVERTEGERAPGLARGEATPGSAKRSAAGPGELAVRRPHLPSLLAVIDVGSGKEIRACRWPARSPRQFVTMPNPAGGRAGG